MRRSIIAALAAAFIIAPVAHAGQVVTFEDFGLPAHSFDNNAGVGGQFVIDGVSFNNAYDATFGVWSGWAISSMTDTTTPGFTNQYSAIPGSGAGGSQTYAVAFTFGPTADPFNPSGSYINLAPGTTPVSVQVTNTTYDYLSMLNGDQFAKKFGPGDYFLLDVRGYTGLAGTGTQVGEVDFYLANFLGSNSSIINTWQTLDLSPLAGAESLQFGLSSSDNNSTFGMNTPAFFAIDNLVLGTSAVPEPCGLLSMALGLIGLGGLAWKRRRVSMPGA
jgi:MYXO-CTERM domain-containing protein